MTLQASKVAIVGVVLTIGICVNGYPKEVKEISAIVAGDGLFRSRQCSSDNDCLPDECCVLSGFRFTVPGCQHRRQLDEICRPGTLKVTNRTLTYPDNSEFYVKEAHYALCPCAKSLVCGKKTGNCNYMQDDEQEEVEKFIDKYNNNYINNY